MADNHSILITDDNPENLRVLSEILKQEGYGVRVALDGESALKSIKSIPPDLVLLDIQLPKMDGYEVCKQLKGQAEYKDIPIIFISAMSEAFNKVLAFEAGGDDYIQKPFQMEEVLARVKTHLQMREYQQALEAANLVLLQQFKSTFEQAAVGIAHIDQQSGRITKVNRRLSQILGFSQDELLRKTVADITHKDFLKSTKADIQKLTEGRISTVTKEKKYLKKDGSYIWGRVTASLVSFKMENESNYFVAVIEDVTDRKEAEDALQESEEKFRVLFEKMAMGSALLDMEGHPLLSNTALQNMIGYTGKELAKMVFTEFTHPEDIDKDWTFFKELIEGNRDFYQMEKRYLHKNGQVIWGNLIVSMVRDNKGHPLHIIGMVENITERKQAELSVQRYQNDLKRLSSKILKTQEEERRHLSRELHDELGQELTALKMDLNSIENHLSADMKTELSDRLEEANQLVDKLLNQIHEIALDLRPKMLDDLGLKPTLNWFCKMYSKRHNIKVQFEMEYTEGPIDSETSTVVYRVTQEALNNIAKHANAKKVNIEISAYENFLQLQIIDDGAGFELDKIQSRPLEQKGYGLISMNERVTDLNGTFNIESAPGKGTQLLVRLPAGQE